MKRAGQRSTFDVLAEQSVDVLELDFGDDGALGNANILVVVILLDFVAQRVVPEDLLVLVEEIGHAALDDEHQLADLLALSEQDRGLLEVLVVKIIQIVPGRSGGP